MRFIWLILCALPLLAQAGPVSVISASGAPQSGTAEAGQTLSAGARLEGDVLLRTPAGATLQLRTADGATLSLGTQSALRLDADKHVLALQSGYLALWSEQNTWDITVANTRLRSKGFLRLRLCAANCQGRPGVYGKVDGGEVSIEYMGGRSVLRNRLFLIGPEGGRPELLARDNGMLDGSANFDGAVAAKQKSAEQLKTALNDFREERFDAAKAILTTLRSESPGEPLVLYYLGLIALQQQRNDDALRDLQQYVKEDPEGAKERDIAKLLTVLTSSELQREVQRAVSQEKDLSAQPPEPGSIAIQTFANQSAPEAAVLAKGFAAMVISDLSKVPGLKVLEREKVQKISDELRLNASDLVAPDSAVRLGRLMRAERVVVGNIGVE
jgi:tetratricopeptide (TPR) repeat protein